MVISAFASVRANYRTWDNKCPWALKIQTDSKRHEHDVKIRRPSGANGPLGAIGARRGAYFTTTANCATTAKCTKHTFSYVYVRTIKLTRKSHVVYTPHIQIRSYHSAKECWELESAAISDKIRSFNRAKQGWTFSMVPSRISKLFFAFIILEILTGLRKK